MVASKLMTADELLALGERIGPTELVEGELRTMSPASEAHGAVGMRIGWAIATLVYTRDLGEVYQSETGFIVRRDPDTVLAPDVAFVRRDRLPGEGLGQRFVPYAPDLAVEVESPSNSMAELLRKVADYLEAGTQLVWLVRPELRTITVFRPGAAEEVLREGDVLGGHDVLPDLALPVADVFRPLNRRVAAEAGS